MSEAITPRNKSFKHSTETIDEWDRQDPMAAALYNALSVIFPLGEHFFVESVRHYLPRLDGKLLKETTLFIQQESIHAREHTLFNQQVTRAGYDTSELEVCIQTNLARMVMRSEIWRLGLTISLEHLSAVLAKQILSKPHHMKDAPALTRELWKWHAYEEIEHKAVTFDVYRLVTRDWHPLKQWAFRSLVFTEACFLFGKVTLLNMRLLNKQKHGNWRTWMRKLPGFLLKSPGLVRGMLGGLIGFYRPGFHPWDQDDTHLLETTELQDIPEDKDLPGVIAA